MSVVNNYIPNSIYSSTQSRRKRRSYSFSPHITNKTFSYLKNPPENASSVYAATFVNRDTNHVGEISGIIYHKQSDLFVATGGNAEWISGSDTDTSGAMVGELVDGEIVWENLGIANESYYYFDVDMVGQVEETGEIYLSIAGDEYSGDPTHLYRSVNGVDFTKVTETGWSSSLSFDKQNVVAYNDGTTVFSVTESGGVALIYTTDGVNFISILRSDLPVNCDVTGIIYNKNLGKYIANTDTDTMLQSNDGVTWEVLEYEVTPTQVSLGSGVLRYAQEEELMYIVSDLKVYTSKDGSTWNLIYDISGYYSDTVYDIIWCGDLVNLIILQGDYPVSLHFVNSNGVVYVNQSPSANVYSEVVFGSVEGRLFLTAGFGYESESYTATSGRLY